MLSFSFLRGSVFFFLLQFISFFFSFLFLLLSAVCRALLIFDCLSPSYRSPRVAFLAAACYCRLGSRPLEPSSIRVLLLPCSSVDSLVPSQPNLLSRFDLSPIHLGGACTYALSIYGSRLVLLSGTPYSAGALGSDLVVLPFRWPAFVSVCYLLRLAMRTCLRVHSRCSL